jgi:hypothetical protein
LHGDFSTKIDRIVIASGRNNARPAGIKFARPLWDRKKSSYNGLPTVADLPEEA